MSQNEALVSETSTLIMVNGNKDGTLLLIESIMISKQGQ